MKLTILIAVITLVALTVASPISNPDEFDDHELLSELEPHRLARYLRMKCNRNVENWTFFKSFVKIYLGAIQIICDTLDARGSTKCHVNFFAF